MTAERKIIVYKSISFAVKTFECGLVLYAQINTARQGPAFFEFLHKNDHLNGNSLNFELSSCNYCKIIS